MQNTKEKSLKLPVQGPSINRVGTSTNYETNVEASFSFGDILNVAKQAASVALPIAQKLLL